MMKKPLLETLKGHTEDIPPIWFMRQAGRYLPEYKKLREQEPNFMSFCQRVDLIVEAVMQPLRRYNLDGAILFSDILVVPYALGQQVDFLPHHGPSLNPIATFDDFKKITFQSFDHFIEAPMEGLRTLKQAIPSHTTLIGFAGGPWTVLCYMVEGKGNFPFPRLQNMLMQEPNLVEDLLKIVIHATSKYLVAQCHAGAEVIQIFDSWASCVPEGFFEKMVMDPTAQIISAIKEEFPDVPIIGFPRQCGGDLKKYVEKTGVDAISFDSTMERSEQVPPCVLQGGIDPQDVVEGGKKMRDRADQVMKRMSGRPFIFNLSHGLVPETPPEHVADLVNHIRQAG